MAKFAFDHFVFDDVRYELWRHGKAVHVERQPLEILALLLRNPSRVITKEELITAVWEGRALSENVISVCVARLRKALGGPPNRHIGTIYGRGYRFMSTVNRLEEAPGSSSASTPAVTVGFSSRDETMVGRSLELGRLRAGLTRASAGRGCVCALVGEAGIGKTRAAEALESEAQAAGFLVSWGRCHVFGDAPPLWPWLQVVRPCAEHLPEELIGQPFEELMRAGETDALSGTSGGQTWESQSTGAWHRTLLWLRTVASRMTAKQPWLIVLEDVQWADAATLALLTHLVAEVSQLRMLLVLTVRDSELATDPRCKRALEYVLGHRDCDLIELQRLRAVDVQAYLERRFGVNDTALEEAVFAKSEGNPFFMVELLRPWDDGTKPTAGALTLSGHSLDIIRQGLRRLEASAVEVLSAAAVIGRSFDLGVLSTVTERSAEALVQILEDALKRRIVIPERDSHTRFAFSHELIRRVLYDDLSSLSCARLHHGVAEALSARGAAVGPVAMTQLAHHLLQASPCGDVSRAVEAARKAAAAAMGVGAYADACGFLRRALEVMRGRIDEPPTTLGALLHDLASCERAAGQPGAGEHFAEAVQLARAHGIVEVLFSAGQRMSSGPGSISMPQANAVLEAALAALPSTDHRRRAIVLSHLSWTPPHCRNFERVEALLLEAEKHAQAGGDAAKRAVLRARLYFAGGPDDHERALQLTLQLERMAANRHPLKRAFLSIEPQLARIMLLMQQCEFKAAERALDAYGAAVRELHHAELLWHYERTCIVLVMNTGDLEQARNRLTELKCRADRLQLQSSKTMAAIDWGEVNRQTTDIRPFASKYLRALSADPNDDPSVQSSKLRMLVQFGLIEEARAALQNLPVVQLYRLPKSREYLVQLANLSIAAAATGAREHAEVLYELLRAYPNLYVASLSLHCHGLVSHALGLLARALGHRARAREHFEHAIQRQEKLGLTLPLTRSRFELGSLLIASADRRERVEGRKALEELREAATKLGLAPLAADACALLG